MAYIGNAKTPLIFASNTRDDIIPVKKADGTFETEFTLSQEVPGGYESNVMVVRRRFVVEPNTPTSTQIQITKTTDPVTGNDVCTLTTQDPILTIVLNDVVPASVNYEGDVVTINTTANANNNGKTVNVLAKSFDGTTLTLTLDISKNNLNAQTGGVTSFNRGYYQAWEILDAEKDYNIVSGTGLDTVNKIISFKIAPQEYDVVYVLHRGDATYNFVPSANSVGAEQLSHNLRNFACDRFTATQGQTTFTLSQDVVSSKAILVFVDDQFTDGDDLSSGYTDGTWQLGADQSSIEFKTPLALDTKVRVLHLGFSTVNRRYAFFPGQQGAAIADQSVTTNKIALGAVVSNRIANGAVTSDKISDDSVDGQKLLLKNGQAIRIKNVAGNPQNVLELSGDDVRVNSPGSGLSLNIQEEVGGTTVVGSLAMHTDGKLIWGGNDDEYEFWLATRQGNSLMASITDAKASLTTYNSLPFTVGHKNGGIEIASSGNVGIATTTPTEKLDVVGNIKASSNVIATNVQTNTINNIPVDQIGCPTGTIVMSAISDPALVPSGWELCQGQTVDGNTVKYSKLYQAIGNTYGGTGANFTLPDLRHRVPVGSSATMGLTGASANEGIADFQQRQLSHRHQGGNHTHTITHNHIIPGHIHSVSKYSTLQIPTPSGTHNTTISGEHKNITTESGGSHTHSVNAFQTNPDPTKLFTKSTIIASSPKNYDEAIKTPPVDKSTTLTHTHRSWPINNFKATGNPYANPDSLVVVDFNPNKIDGGSTPDTLPILGSALTGGDHFHTVYGHQADEPSLVVNGVNYDTYLYPEIARTQKKVSGVTQKASQYDSDDSFRVPNNKYYVDNAVKNTDGAHSHNVKTTLNEWYVANNKESLVHSHFLFGRTGSDAETYHSHLIKSIPWSGMDQDGKHIHLATEFSGSLGVANILCKTTQPIVSGSTILYLAAGDPTASISDIKIGYKIPSTLWGVEATVVSIAATYVTLSAPATINIPINTFFSVVAPSGDSDLITTNQNNTNSGPATQNYTDLQTIPYIILNFLIKL